LSYTTGINDAGQVVGFSIDATLQHRRAFLWDSTHGMTDLGATSDFAETSAINAYGSVVGGGESFFGFAWTPNEPNGTSGTMTDLVTGVSSSAFDINDAGQIVGWSSTTYYDPNPCDPDGPYFCPGSGGEVRQAILWENGVATGLTILPENAGVTLESANAINATGQIVAASGDVRAYLLTPVNGPTLSVGDVSVVEGHSGTVSALFTVRLSEASNQTVTVNFASADGTATAGSDYEAQSGTLIFAPGETTKTVPVLVRGDRLGEGNESFVVNLSGATSALIADRQGVGTIIDDEPLLTIASVWRQEGNSGQAAMTFALTLSRTYDIPVTVDYTTVNGSAIAGSDYIAAAGTAMIPSGQTTGTIIVQVRGDTLPESDEYFSVMLTGSNVANFSNYAAYGNILDDDTPPSISIGDAYMTEGNSGTRSMSFTVSLSRPSGQAVSVNYATANGTAKTSDNDYTAASGRLDFAPGDTTKTITVTIRGDTRKETDEYLLVKLSGAVGATLADSQGQGTIANDGGGGKGNGMGNHSNSFASAVDAAIDDWMTSPRKKRGW